MKIDIIDQKLTNEDKISNISLTIVEISFEETII
jgi:hypothetical protein